MAVRRNSRYYDLRFVVQCNDGMGSPAGFRPIAAFDLAAAAFMYIDVAGESGFEYQVCERGGDHFKVIDRPAEMETPPDNLAAGATAS